MRRWIQLAAKLYPRGWRERYGVEFDALMEEVEPDWRELSNVFGGAVMMQVKSGMGSLKLAGAIAVAGAIVAGGYSFSLPNRYISTAVMRITPLQVSDPELARQQSIDRLQSMETDILSRTSLAEIITKPSLDLYRAEREQLPLEDVVQQMRNRDVSIRPVETGPHAPHGNAFAVSFAYPDKKKAQAVVRELITKFTEQNVMVERNRYHIWKAWTQDLAKSGITPPEQNPTHGGENLEVLDPASLPVQPAWPNHWSFAALGLGGGLLLGLIAAVALRRPKFTLRVAAFAAIGCALAAAVSFLLPERYTSTAVMRTTPPIDPKRWYGPGGVRPISERLPQWEQEILSRESLAAIVAKPSLDLYAAERRRMPMEEVIARMRNRDIRIQSMGPAFAISFSYPDRVKAQAVVREFVTRFVERNFLETREVTRTAAPDVVSMAEYRMGENLEVLDPASLPESPVWPNRIAIAGIGLAAGILLGLIPWRIGSRRTLQAAAGSA